MVAGVYKLIHTVCVISYSLPYGDLEENRKGNTKGLHGGIVKTKGAPHGILCTKSLWEVLN